MRRTVGAGSASTNVPAATVRTSTCRAVPRPSCSSTSPHSRVGVHPRARKFRRPAYDDHLDVVPGQHPGDGLSTVRTGVARVQGAAVDGRAHASMVSTTSVTSSTVPSRVPVRCRRTQPLARRGTHRGTLGAPQGPAAPRAAPVQVEHRPGICRARRLVPVEHHVEQRRRAGQVGSVAGEHRGEARRELVRRQPGTTVQDAAAHGAGGHRTTPRRVPRRSGRPPERRSPRHGAPRATSPARRDPRRPVPAAAARAAPGRPPARQPRQHDQHRYHCRRGQGRGGQCGL